jgi:transcriptional regulator with XRE-family HTH domain
VTGTPALRLRLLGMALRRYREAAGYRPEDAAAVLECDRSKISRIETGQRGIRPKELRELLAEYGVGGQELAFLVAIANPRRASGWWQDYDDVLTGDQRDVLIMESLAAQVWAYHAQQIPVLLQTGEYARAVRDASAFHAVADAGQRPVQAMLARQAAILGAKEPELAVVIAEGALHQQVGGADVMRGQLTRLAELSGSSRLSIQVLPFAAGAHPAFDAGGLTILIFAEAPDLGIVHLPGISGGRYLEDRDDVARHGIAFSRIRDAALSVPASAAMLRRLAAG